MIPRRSLCRMLKYTTGIGVGVLLLMTCFESFEITSIETDSATSLNHPVTRIQRNIARADPDLITLVSVMCHGPQLQSGPHDTTLSPTGRKGISRQLRQANVMLKSLLLMEHEYLRQYNRTPDSDRPTLELILFTDYKEYYEELMNFLYSSGEINPEYLKPLRLTYAPVVYPKGYEHMKYFFRPCSTLRLFMDKMLPHQDAVVYLDTDLIFLKPVHELYGEFYTFNQTQWCAMGMDWYHHHHHTGKIPYYGAQGLNAGVGVYNLTRMRSVGFAKTLDTLLKDYLDKTLLAEQDILNVYFHFHPQELQLLPCHQNYIPNYCFSDNRCQTNDNGVTLLHGITMSFMPGTAETQFHETFEFFKSLNLTQVLQLEMVQDQLRRRLTESGRAREPGRQDHCIGNLNFGDEILGPV